MDWVALKDKIPDVVKKYRFALLVLVIGIALMLIPAQKEQVQQEQVITETSDNILSVEEQLSQLLSLVHGAGKVQVMLTVSSGEETLYQTNDSDSVSQDSSTTDRDTVTITDASRNEYGLVRQINPPVYLGAIVVCQGADSPAVRLSIVEAVSKITGLGADKISVLKMK